MLSQRKILFFWLPLFASWLLMTVEGPLTHAVIARLPDPVISLAAFGIVMSLAITIESPIIMLLATSTTLAIDRQAYLVLRSFTLHLNLLITLIAAVVAFYTPLYNWLVLEVMGIPANIAETAQVGMRIMVFWGAAIGWRRFNQGILIRFGYTKRVTYGTVIRLFFTGSATFGAGFLLKLPGVWSGAIGMMSGVVAEALFIHWTTLDVKARHYHPISTPDEAPLTYREVVMFHTPLAATSLLSLLAQPLIGMGLARMALPQESLAVWPVIFNLTFIFRSAAFALPEAVIALSQGAGTFKPIRNFCLGVGLGTTALMLSVLITPISQIYLATVIGLSTDLVQIAMPGLVISLMLPFLSAVQNWLRGLLMKAKSTNYVYQGMGLNLVITAMMVFTGVLWQTPGIQTATLALNVATLFETLFLWLRAKPIVDGDFNRTRQKTPVLSDTF